MRNLLALALCALVALPAAAQHQNAVSAAGAVLRALDKVDGKTIDVTVRSGGAADAFGLTVELADCRYPADNPTGDAFAFLIIRDIGASDVDFQGWMIASAPALNALDHSRYDVWVLRCITS
ncbi:DUF2155 domain-containing protein [Sedimentitalea todarodis]|uniref:DUF2155 domain-containing protein n=1 Tax=Sedimentitalea todarodis TaxID=1631240 RepID=A0ABU3V8K3_9RHOB|nr:DUF2155 domain-containing protein [Sedimentitalea todarodis]MDU9002499.1 DUF2155 domain-containing protein [Sedimentitalea todarodis]